MKTDKWLVHDKNGWYNLQITDDVVSNPKSHYNSEEGKKYREFSNQAYELIVQKKWEELDELGMKYGYKKKNNE